MKKGSTGVTFRVNLNFDASSYTELSIVFIKPNGTQITKTTADGVTLGAVAVTDADLGPLEANKYLEYETEDIFDVAGPWRVYGLYTNTTPTPNDKFPGDTTTFEVEDPLNPG